ncbi:MAG: glycine zipper 2TM domain-containing protein [Gammaproteobacteria bacterium]|nr:glycine zipper 2TM domain-containing protein [Gammaproteobacteria bacterium]
MSKCCVRACTPLIVIALLALSSPTGEAREGTAPADPWLGATIGGLVGSTIGQGDGRKVATAVGAVIGYQLAADTADGLSRQHYRRLERRCRASIPAAYSVNAGAAKAWVEGCIDREIANQQGLEQAAYEHGRNQENDR